MVYGPDVGGTTLGHADPFRVVGTIPAAHKRGRDLSAVGGEGPGGERQERASDMSR